MPDESDYFCSANSPDDLKQGISKGPTNSKFYAWIKSATTTQLEESLNLLHRTSGAQPLVQEEIDRRRHEELTGHLKKIDLADNRILLIAALTLLVAIVGVLVSCRH